MEAAYPKSFNNGRVIKIFNSEIVFIIKIKQAPMAPVLFFVYSKNVFIRIEI